MNIIRQLYQLQEIDSEFSSNEQALNQITNQLGENQVVVRAQSEFTSVQQRLEELKQQQRDSEWEIDELVSKITTSEEKLYSGKVGNPKELASLQHEVDILKVRRAQLEDKVLEVMGQVELTAASVATTASEFKKLEIEWHRQQKQLSAAMEQLKTVLSGLEQKRQSLADKMDHGIVELYHELKQQKGIAVAKVEQGVCRGCRISLSAAELQRTRSGSLVQCGSCGRILLLA